MGQGEDSKRNGNDRGSAQDPDAPESGRPGEDATPGDELGEDRDRQDDLPGEPDEEGADIVWEEGLLVSDTQETVRREGTRSGTTNERRLLFQGDRVYVEVRVPQERVPPDEGCWLYGQFVVPDEMAGKYDLPMLAVLQGQEGVTGAMRMSVNGEFALPFRGKGEQILEFEPREAPVGPGFRIRFET